MFTKEIDAGDMSEKSSGAIVYTVEDGVIKYLLVCIKFQHL